MVCRISCITYSIAAIGLLCASLFTMNVSDKQHKTLQNMLSPEIAEKYERITKERRNLYLQGLLLGMLLSYVIVKFVLQSMMKESNRFYNVSIFVTITLLTSIFYYSLMPKSDYMLNHLKTVEENKAWLDIYKTMKNRYMLSFLIGSLSAIPLAYSLC